MFARGLDHHRRSERINHYFAALAAKCSAGTSPGFRDWSGAGAGAQVFRDWCRVMHLILKKNMCIYSMRLRVCFCFFLFCFVLCVCVFVCLYVCMSVCMDVICVCRYVCNVCMYACMLVCMYACMHVCM